MAFFTEQMEMLANELLTSRHERGAFVNEVRQRSHKVLADAQIFMHGLSREHGAMAERLRIDLAANGQERLRGVKAQRQQNQEHLQSLRSGLQAMLTQTRQERQQHVAELRTECCRAQKDLAGDLRQASQVWQRRFQACATTNGGHKGKVNVTPSATVTQARSPEKGEEPSHPDHSHSHPAHATDSTHHATHGGHHGKAKEPRHSH